jgi:uncharacterized protein (TIGR02147 family)
MEPFYLQRLKEDLSRRQRKSPSYSLRAFARDLDLHPATLSLMFKGKRSLPFKNSVSVADKLNLGPKERTYFLESLHREKTSLDKIKISDNDDRFMLDESYFAVIAEWEHDAILTLMDCSDFIFSKEEISERLSISSIRTEVVINNLLQCGLLIQNESGFSKAYPSIRTTEDIASTALKLSHKETMDIGKDKLEDVDVMMRDFSSMMIAVDTEKMTEAKTIIREFRQKMSALLRDGHKTDVYQLAIQFYPLTKNDEKRSLS